MGIAENTISNKFQSPRSGKFESNINTLEEIVDSLPEKEFQSPRSGKFESNINLKGVI